MQLKEGILVYRSDDADSSPFRLVGKIVVDSNSTEHSDSTAYQVEFPSYFWNSVSLVDEQHLQVASRIVEMQSEDHLCARTITLSHSLGSRSCSGYASSAYAVPDGVIDVYFHAVGGAEICAVDRGSEDLPWIRVREKDSPLYPYKREHFRYSEFPKHVRYMLRGTAFNSYVARVEVDDDIEHLCLKSIGSKLPLRNNFFEGASVYFAFRGDDHIPYGAKGKVVGATVGPRGEDGYIRVRFGSSTWDLQESCLATVADSSCSLCLYHGCEWCGPCCQYSDHKATCPRRPQIHATQGNTIRVYNTTSVPISIWFSASAAEDVVPSKTSIKLVVRVSARICIKAGLDMLVTPLDAEIGYGKWSPVSDILVHEKDKCFVVQRFDRAIHDYLVSFLVGLGEADDFLDAYAHSVWAHQHAYGQNHQEKHPCERGNKYSSGHYSNDFNFGAQGEQSFEATTNDCKNERLHQQRHGKVRRLLGAAIAQFAIGTHSLVGYVDKNLGAIVDVLVAFLTNEVDNLFLRGWETGLCNAACSSPGFVRTRRGTGRYGIATGIYLGASIVAGGIASIPISGPAVFAGAAWYMALGASVAVDITDNQWSWTSNLAERVLPETRDELFEMLLLSRQKSFEAARKLVGMLESDANDLHALKAKRKKWLLSLHPDRNFCRSHKHFDTVVLAFSLLLSEARRFSIIRKQQILALTDS